MNTKIIVWRWKDNKTWSQADKAAPPKAHMRLSELLMPKDDQLTDETQYTHIPLTYCLKTLFISDQVRIGVF